MKLPRPFGQCYIEQLDRLGINSHESSTKDCFQRTTPSPDRTARQLSHAKAISLATARLQSDKSEWAEFFSCQTSVHVRGHPFALEQPGPLSTSLLPTTAVVDEQGLAQKVGCGCRRQES